MSAATDIQNPGVFMIMYILHMGDWRFRLFAAFIAYWCG
jgi:hypothetical protein